MPPPSSEFNIHDAKPVRAKQKKRFPETKSHHIQPNLNNLIQQRSTPQLSHRHPHPPSPSSSRLSTSIFALTSFSLTLFPSPTTVPVQPSAQQNTPFPSSPSGPDSRSSEIVTLYGKDPGACISFAEESAALTLAAEPSEESVPAAAETLARKGLCVQICTLNLVCANWQNACGFGVTETVVVVLAMSSGRASGCGEDVLSNKEEDAEEEGELALAMSAVLEKYV
jgi:hypothetical protein